MPKGPKGERRPADVIGAAIMVARIATGEIEERSSNSKKRKAGQVGSNARTLALTSEQRSEIARTAAAARWKKTER